MLCQQNEYIVVSLTSLNLKCFQIVRVSCKRMESSEGSDNPDTFSRNSTSETTGVSGLKFIGSVGIFESSVGLFQDTHSGNVHGRGYCRPL